MWSRAFVLGLVHAAGRFSAVLLSFMFLRNVSSAGSLRAGHRVDRRVRVGITVSHRRKQRARRLAGRAWFGLGVACASVMVAKADRK
jgi:hypothetical protein